MIRHIVCFKLTDNSPEACEKTRRVLLSMAMTRLEHLRISSISEEMRMMPMPCSSAIRFIRR